MTIEYIQRVLCSRFRIADGCWVWTGSTNSRGYGQITINKKSKKAHRVMYELIRGTIPDGMELDHLCRVKSCVNPEHLEAVTHSENIKRSPTVSNPPRRRKYHEQGNCLFCNKEAPKGKLFCSYSCRSKDYEARQAKLNQPNTNKEME